MIGRHFNELIVLCATMFPQWRKHVITVISQAASYGQGRARMCLVNEEMYFRLYKNTRRGFSEERKI